MAAETPPVPIDPHAEDDDELLEEARRRFTEFECPLCDAVNPCDDGFSPGDDVLCCYCGQEFRAEVANGGRLQLRER